MKNPGKQSHKVLLIIIALFISKISNSQTVTIFSNPTNKQAQIAINDIKASLPDTYNIEKNDITKLSKAGEKASIVFVKMENEKAIAFLKKSGKVVDQKIEPEGYSLKISEKSNQKIIWIVGQDDAGLLYGGFEVAEQIRLQGFSNIKEKDENPYMKMRGVKFNISLDYRTPTYSDPGDAARMNVKTMWDFNFWKEYLNKMAKSRYNFISFWNLHPFPSMVKVPEYPKVALNDVMRSAETANKKVWLRDRFFNKMSKEEILKKGEIVLKMSIDEKIDFWRTVMEYAKERNIDIYFITWNIFVNGTFGQYGITDEITNNTTIDYFRKSVKQMFLTYPLLAGIGLTTGENIPGATTEEKEDWAFNTYGKGLLDVAKEQSNRFIRFIHRQHEAKVEDVFEKFNPLLENPNIDFIFSYKYAKAHSYSSVNQPYKDNFVKVIQKSKSAKTIWTLRNDSNYLLRWGGADFIRQFIKNIPIEVSQGYYFGSDGYIWGRDFVSKYPLKLNQIDISKHWYSWMLWGRLGYNPNLTNDFFISLLQNKFAKIDASLLFNAWQNASMTYPLTTGFHWGSLDFMWYPEACQSDDVTADTYSGFLTIDKFITQKTHPGTDNITIPKFVENTLKGKEQIGTTPIMVAQQLNDNSDKALSVIDSLKCGGNFELWQIFEDIRAMAFLGKYYACKINAATEIAFYRKTNELKKRKSATEQLQLALYFWRNYIATLTSMNKSSIYFKRIGLIDWHKSFYDVLHELVSFAGEQEIKSTLPKKGGVLLEAENGNGPIIDKRNSIRGFTGSGYVRMDLYAQGDTFIEWNYNIPEDGLYLLEVRYTNWENPRINNGKIFINDNFASDLITWGTGTQYSWSSDKIYLQLKKGYNNIKFYPRGRINVDNLNIIELKNL